MKKVTSGIFKNVYIYMALLIVLICCGNYGILTWNTIWKCFLPSFAVIVGIKFIYNGIFKFRKRYRKHDVPEFAAIFTSKCPSMKGKHFEGADIDVAFGAYRLELEGVDVYPNSVINANIIFGNVTISVPKDCKVILAESTLFGDSVSHRHNYRKKGNGEEKYMYINATVLFGKLLIV